MSHKHDTRKKAKGKASKSTTLTTGHSDSEDEYLSATNSPSHAMKIDPSDFVHCLKAALIDPDIVQQLQACFVPMFGEMKKDLESCQSDITNLKITINQKDREIRKLHSDMDDLQQAERNRTIQIDGIPEPVANSNSASTEGQSGSQSESQKEENVADTVAKYFTNSLKIPTNVWDVTSAYRVPLKDKSKPKRIVVTLLSQDRRNKVLKARRTILRQNAANKVFINEDLIPKRQEIYRTARLAAKEGKLFKTWVFAGDIYISKKKDDEPIVVKSLSGLYLHIPK